MEAPTKRMGPGRTHYSSVRRDIGDTVVDIIKIPNCK